MPYSPQQLIQLAQQAGFQGNDAVKMAAISMAESGGDPTAHNTNAATGDNSYGLAQINMLGSMGPARLKQFGLKSNDQLFDPVNNLKAAKAIQASSGWGAWSTASSGSYQKFMPTMQKAAAGLPNTPTTQSPVNQQSGNVYNYYISGDTTPDTAQNFLTSFLPKIAGITSKRDPLSDISRVLFSTPNYLSDDASSYS